MLLARMQAYDGYDVVKLTGRAEKRAACEDATEEEEHNNRAMAL